MTVLERFRRARRWRQCPKCEGVGSDVIDTILRHNFIRRPCSLCGGDGKVRYRLSVALRVALRGRTDHEDDLAQECSTCHETTPDYRVTVDDRVECRSCQETA